ARGAGLRLGLGLLRRLGGVALARGAGLGAHEGGGGAGGAACRQVAEQHHHAQQRDDRGEDPRHEPGGRVDGAADPLEPRHAPRLVEDEGAEEDEPDGSREVSTRHRYLWAAPSAPATQGEGAGTTYAVTAA